MPALAEGCLEQGSGHVSHYTYGRTMTMGQWYRFINLNLHSLLWEGQVEVI